MDNTALGFWRDEAKLTILLPEKRWNSYVALATSISIGGLGVTVYKIFSDPTLVVAACATLALPLYSIAELFFKGGQAGARLMASAPIELFDVEIHFEKLQKWLETSTNIPPNMRQLQTRIFGMFHDLVGCDPAGYPPPNDSDREGCLNYMRTLAPLVKNIRQMLTPSRFNKEWKPPRWLLEIEAELERDAKYDPRISA